MREGAKNSAELISDYGKAALFTLAGKELKQAAALDIRQMNRIGEGSFETQEYFKKPPKTSRYAPKVYKEWDGKRGKSKSSQVFRYRDCSTIQKRAKKIKVNRVVNSKISGKFSFKSNCRAASIGCLPPMYLFNN